MQNPTKLLFIFVSIFIINSCETNNTPAETSISGKLISNTDCKSFKATQGLNDTPDSLTCILYSFDSKTKILSILHLNAGFNCCPGELSCDIRIEGDTIIVEEMESEYLCRCNCLYDLDIEVKGLTENKHSIKFIEPYSGTGEKILIDIDLTINTSGTYCIVRKNYPWGMSLFD